MSEETEGQQSLIEHLSELRDRLIRSLVFVFIGFLISWAFSDLIFDIIRTPIQPHLATESKGLVFTAPMDKFLAHLKISFLAGVIISCPFWIYQVWMFVAPGLYSHEKKYAASFISFGTVLFLAGVSFVYFIVFPMAFEFLMNFGGGTDQPMITISDYISFFVTTTLVFGLAFEMPLIITVLGMMGVVDHHFLAAKRRYAIVILAAMSAILTPPDIISMVLMMIPMILLYESSVILVRIFGAKET